MNSIQTHSPQETKNFAKKYAKKLRGGEVLALYGELGSGKTTFTQGLTLGLGIKKRVISPTFVIMRDYAIPQKSYRLYHLDLYRINNALDIKSFDFHELVEEGNNIIVIEWPEKIEKLIPKHAKKFKFTQKSENSRQITY